MANTSRKGFKPYGRPIQTNPYTAGGTIYKGDLVKLASDGTVVVCAAGAAGAVGCAMNYAVATETVTVADDPNQLFVGQADDGTISAATNLNLNYNIVAGSADTLYRRSGMEIDASSGATDSNLPVKVLRLHTAQDNAFGAQGKFVCKINNHQLGSGADVGTLGV